MWRECEALLKLRDQVNARWPKRSKSSDGTIGDEAHQTRDSDHNPWIKEGTVGIVSAMDITHDPVGGFDSYAFADMLVKNRDPRIKYVISNRRIAAGTEGPQPWVWRKYTGSNPHDHHVHISVKSDKAHYDNKGEWKIDELPLFNLTTMYVAPKATVKAGDRGDLVLEWQKRLDLPLTSVFDLTTHFATKYFQLKKGLVDDGVVGPQTWKASEK